ncbi:hypothetical protein KPL71_021887 [Citrus sinensis]|uniref:Uncharacterized protein n=1 Tax=Citrus sinensis TaxID=2711 RepID=A0ACB8JIT4_CITSI|nr:hypothetical protein KPL71_021887 [Citrus sinensis]
MYAQERIKLDKKSRRCIFLGYVDGVKEYRLWDPTAHKIVISRYVIFVEDQLQRKDENDSTIKEKSEAVPVYVKNNPEHNKQEPIEFETPEVRRSTQDEESSTFHETLNRPDVALWMTAMHDEIEALHKNKTWKLVPLSHTRKGIGNNRVYKIKRDGNDQVERYRARLVAPMCWYKRFDSFIMSFGYNRLSSDHCAYYKRPDIAQAVRVVSRYMTNSGGEHWKTVKKILRYIRGTLNVALCYRGSEFTVRGYVDSDFAGDLDKRKSTIGYVFTLAGGAVNWLSKLQTVVALSITEAEYTAATQACKEAIWIQRLLKELRHKQQKILVFCDSQSALHIARNLAFHSRTKHIGVQYHFVREVIKGGNVDLQKIHTKENLADVLIKPINVDKFVRCRSSCGLIEMLAT